MMGLLRKITRSISFLASLVFSYKIYMKAVDWWNHVVSLSLARSFKNCGKSFNIENPIIVTGEKYISIGDKFSAGRGFYLGVYPDAKYPDPQIDIGERVSIGDDCQITAINRVVIEDHVLIGSRVLITDHGHGDSSLHDLKMIPIDRPHVSKGQVLIRKNCWIGSGVAIMPGVTIGENSIIGANAVVTRDVPANSVAGGNPAKIIKTIS